MPKHTILVAVVLLVLDPGICDTYNVGGMDGNGGSCTYNFQVWTANQDVIKRIQNVETKCDISSAHIQQNLAELKLELHDQVFLSHNLTQSLQKQLLHYQVDDVKLDLAIKDLKLEMMENREESSKIWAFINQIQSSLLKGVLSGQNPTLPVVTTASDQQILNNNNNDISRTIGQLKNGVGNLKAEWLLIKRDVQDIKSDSTQLKQSMDSLEEDSLTLRGSTKWVQEELKRMNHSLEKLRAKVVNNKEQNDDSFKISDYPYDDELYDGIQEMRTKYRVLIKEMGGLSENFTSLQQQIQDLVQTTTATLFPTPTTTSTTITSRGRYHHQHKTKVNVSVKITQAPAKDCHDIYLQGYSTSGVYQIKPLQAPELDNVYCEMINQSGWTLLQRREDGLISFDRLWMEYKHGFGSLYGEFWIGNEMMHLLTSQGEYVLRIDMWDWEGHRTYAEYNSFKVGPEESLYKLSVKSYSGNAGDSLSLHEGMSFTTDDKDNDLDLNNCASKYKGGWWFDSCYASHLNGLYHTGNYFHQNRAYADGIVWYTYKESEFYSLKKVEMKVRPYFV